MALVDQYGKELTKPQTLAQRGSLSGLFGAFVQDVAPPPPCLSTYREMRSNPTIAIGRVVSTLPIRTMPWTLEADDGVPEERVAWLQGELERLWPRLIKELCFAKDFGFSAFEKIWQPAGNLVTLGKLKYLLPELTQVRVDPDNGSFAGLKQGRVEVPPEKALVYTYDREGDNFYGRSHFENVRESAYSTWVNLALKLGIYVKKAAGAVAVVEYPEGQSQVASGQTKSNFEIATGVLARLGQGDGIAMPNANAANAIDLARAGIDPDKWRAWRLTFVEAGQHGAEFTELMRHQESLMLRGLIVPERSVIEGSFGTKAEAETHGALGDVLSSLDGQDMLRHLNDYLLAPWCGINWGIDAEGSIRLEAKAVDKAQQAFFRELVTRILAGPLTAEAALTMLDIATILSRAEVPKLDRAADRDPLVDEARAALKAQGGPTP